VTLAVAGESLYQLREQLEPLVSADLPAPLLVYLPGRQEAEGRKVLLELIRAGTVFAIELVNRARGYLREHLEPEKVEQLLQRPDLTYREVAHALEQSGGEGFSLLKALFQQELKRSSPPENGELARAWLVNDQLDEAIITKNLCNELADLLRSRWNLGFPADEPLPQWRLRAQRALLLHEFLRDWQGDELTAFRKQALPTGKVAAEGRVPGGLRRHRSIDRSGARAAGADRSRTARRAWLHRYLPLRGSVFVAQRGCLSRKW
jgi:hypothetical protein